MSASQPNFPRAFKTAWFNKAARKGGISDEALCVAIREAMQGQAIDLGGGVFKKRLQHNRFRSLILARGGNYWIYAYLFAKQERDNIDDDELDDFRLLAKAYAGLSREKL